MCENIVISIDIGSTYTKGALFDISTNEAKILKQAIKPTTQQYLPSGAVLVVKSLLEICEDKPISEIDLPPIYWSSSAKGGLKIVVLGLVPELSLEIGRLVAWSSGARVSTAFSYTLTSDAVKQIEIENPDILLMCGGTNGGHEKTGVKNAKKIAASKIKSTIIYAGNSSIHDEVKETLSNKKLIIADNVMPDIGRFESESACEKIRNEFLTSIVMGKGLNDLVKLFNSEPSPTPRAVLDLVKTIPSNSKSWGEFLTVDMGGATTDVYSHSPAYFGDESVFLRGIIEPIDKRSVEGDLGMRVTSEPLFNLIKPEVLSQFGNNEEMLTKLEKWVEQLQVNPELISTNNSDKEMDLVLACGCIRHAITRHAGQLEQSWTPAGKVWLQKGKDLRNIPKIVFTGGYAANNPAQNFFRKAFQNFHKQASDKEKLVPVNPKIYVDNLYIWPLLGNIVSHYPEAVTELAISNLTDVSE